MYKKVLMLLNQNGFCRATWSHVFDFVSSYHSKKCFYSQANTIV